MFILNLGHFDLIFKFFDDFLMLFLSFVEGML